MSNTMVLIAIFAILSFTVACHRQEKPDSPKRKTEAMFPWQDRTVFVIYAGHTENDNPDETFPSLALLEYDETINFMNIDGAPYLTVLTGYQMRQQLKDDAKKAALPENLKILDKIDNWVKTHIDQGYTFFFYELEPPELVGKAYPIAKKAEEEID